MRRFRKKLGPNPPSLRRISEEMYDEDGLANDCFACALAKSEGLALLCVGDDFAQTDIELA